MSASHELPELTGVAEAYSQCDICPAAPKVRYKHLRDQTDLVFCQHHATQFDTQLKEQFFQVVDNYDG